MAASAAVEPPEIKYTATDFKQYHASNSVVALTYSLLGEVDTSLGDATFELDESTGEYTAYTSKKSSKPRHLEYIAFKAEIEVPALTEYEVTISYSLFYKMTTSGSANIIPQIYYYGNTFDDANAQDMSAQMTFSGSAGYTPSSADGNDYLVAKYNSGKTSGVIKKGTMAQITMENTSTQAETYTAFFGFATGAEMGTQYNNYFNSNLTLSDTILVTPIDNVDGFGLDKTADDYTGEEKEFTVQNLDTQRVVLTSFTRKKLNGEVETLYTYSNDKDETTVGTDPLNGGTVIKAVKAGTYTLKFDIYYWCGAVWNSTTNDQSTKTFTFTINPKEIDNPTMAETQKEQTYTGSAIGYTFSSPLSTADWAKYVKELDKNKMTVSDGGVKDSVVDKRNKTVEITHVGTYNLKFELADAENTVWADPSSTTGATTLNGITVGGTKDFTLKVTAATLTTSLNCNSIKEGNWMWDSGKNDVEITVEVSGFKLDSDTDETDSKHVTLAYYYKENKEGSAEIPLTGSGVVTEEIYNSSSPLKITAKIKMPTSIKPNANGYIFGVKPDGTSGANGNYVVKESEATHAFAVNSASLDPSTLLWTYQKDGVNSNKVLAQNGKITYETKEVDGKRVAVTFSPYIWILKEGEDGYDYTDFVEIDGNYGGATSANAVKDMNGNTTRQTTVTLKIKDGDTEHVFANPGGSANVVLKDGGRTAVVTLNWEMEQKEITLSDVKFQYKSAPVIDKWTDYDADNPPQKTGVSFTVQVPTVNLPEGVNSVKCDPDGNTKGPGTIKFTFDFELDENYKAKDNKSILTYTMEVTGTQVNVNWVVTTLKDADGKEITDDGIPYQIYKLDVPESDPAYKFIKYRYYKVNTVDGEYVKGDEIVGGIDEVVKSVADGGLGASSTNLVQVYCEVYLDGMGKDNGVDPFVLKTSEKQKEYKVYYVGESKDAVDLTAGKVEEIIYGNGGNLLNANDLYNLIIRDSGGIALGVNFYKVSLYDKDEKICIAEEVRKTDGNEAFDFLKLNVGEYKLVFELINGADEDYILISTHLPFTVKAVELTAPSLKDGVTFTYNGEVHSIVDNLIGFNGEYMEFAAKSLYDGVTDAGSYNVIINIKEEYKGNYVFVVPDTEGSDITPETTLINITVEKKEIAIPTISEMMFSGEYINLTDYLGGSYAEYAGIISISGDYLDIRNVSKSGYKARLVLTDPNYKWATPTAAEPAGKKLYAAKLFANELAVLDDLTVELNWNITPLTVDTSELWAKDKNGAMLNLPENIAKLIGAETLSVLYRYYDDAEQYIESPELKGGKSFRVEAVFGGIDAESGNVLFVTADGNYGVVSDKISYTVPQSGFAAAMGSALNFLKANWLWIVIAAAVLLFLIILICVIASAKKKKRKREALEEQRRLEKEEREREERRLEREERMARLSQQQAAPQMPTMMQMPQMMPQMQMPMAQPQYAPQPMAQPAAAGSSNEIAELKAEISAMKAEAAAKESAALRAEVMRAEQAAMKAEQNAVMRSDINALRGSEQISGISVEAMTDIMTMALKNVLASATQQVVAAQTSQPAQLTDGSSTPASTQVPPDAVMTTVTTTKIDTTKKPVQNSNDRAPMGRPIVRNYVAPMPVDDGRVFDVGGFYKPADPSDDLANLLGEEEDKKD